MRLSENKKEWVFAGAVFLLEWALGIYLGYHRILLSDAMTRTANAFYVFYTIPHRLFSMGLRLNPLPSVIQFPLVLLSKLWRPLVTGGISMAFASALFQAWAVKTLYSCFHKMKCREGHALLFTLLYALNPYIVFYGANGMSEIMMGAAGIQVICSLTLWMRKGRPQYILSMAFSLVIMFLVRWEALPFALFIGICMAIHMLTSNREKRYYSKEGLESLWYVEGTLWVTFLPVLFTACVWIFYNWSMTGNPFYFINSANSLSALSSNHWNYGGFPGVMSFVFSRSWPFLIPLVLILAARLVTGKLIHHDTAIVLIAVLGTTVFTTVMMLFGKSGGYVRYFCYPLMFSAAFMPYLLNMARKASDEAARIAAFGFAVCAVFFGWAFTRSSLFREDLLMNVPAYSEELADFLNSHCNDGKILMDSYRGYYVIMNMDEPEKLIINSSEGFEDAVNDPVRCHINYLVVSEYENNGNMDILNETWPYLFSGGEVWTEELASIGEFKVFRVIR